MTHSSDDIEVHLTYATDGLETDGLDVEASESRYLELVRNALLRAFMPRSVHIHMQRQRAPALSVVRHPDDVSVYAIESVIEQVWLQDAWRVPASVSEARSRETRSRGA